MKYLSILLLYALSVMSARAEVNYQNLDSLVIQNKIEAKVKSIGGYQEECIRVIIENLTEDTVHLIIEPGRRLESEDSTIQDIFIVKTRKLDLAPLAKDSLMAYGFCCQSSNGGPYTNAVFSIGYVAPPYWLLLANVIDNNNFPVGAMQSAIWVVSNDHPISSIHADDMRAIEPLRKVVAEIKGVELPWYSMSYVKDTARVFTDEPELVYGNVDYYINQHAVVTINVKNKYGKIMSVPLPESGRGSGNYTYHMNLNVLGWPKGEYTVFIYQDYSNLKVKKTFKI